MENPKASAIARLKEANNVLVTVSNNPSVDQLAGAIGLTLLLNKLGKHATAVFSGDIPSTIEFLQPEQTLEKNTDSLRDFIISLDKSKADKLRYKVEEKLVRIFITPYHTSLSHDDLEFSLGDFNVDVIVALGVHEQQELDTAIAAHGRILHDATIISVNTVPNGSLGTISWVDEKASSLSEMLTDIGLILKNDVLDAQMATALLTGIVAETNRFSNQKTTSATMSLSAKLMAAGANQQLVATKLQENLDNMLPEAQPDSYSAPADEPENNGNNPDGSLRIDHYGQDTPNTGPATGPMPVQADERNDNSRQPDNESHNAVPDTPKRMTEPPSRGGTLTASGQSYDDVASSVNPLSLPPIDAPLLSHDSDKKREEKPSKEEPPKEKKQKAKKTEKPAKKEEPADESKQKDEPSQPPEPQKESPTKIEEDNKTLSEIEQAVDSPHIKAEESAEDLDLKDLQADGEEQPAAAGAQPVDLDLGHDVAPSATVTPTAQPNPVQNDQYLDVTKIDEETGEPVDPNKSSDDATSGTSGTPQVGFTPPPLIPPPPVPPPLMTNPPTMTFGEQPLPNNEDENQPQQPMTPL